MLLKLIVLLCFFVNIYALGDVRLQEPYIGSRVINGHDAQEGEFPYIVSLQRKISNFGTHTCAGSILNERWILTASHCVERLKNASSEILNKYVVKAGKHKLSIIENSEQSVGIESVYLHENYTNFDNEYAVNDIALIKTKASIKFNNKVAKIDLPKKNSEAHGNVVLAGWGGTANSMISLVLQRATVPIVKRKICNEAAEKAFHENGQIDIKDPVTETNICTGPLGGNISVCHGDSGGPLTFIKKNKEKEIIGIVSWTPVDCYDVSVYARVSSYIDWIADIMSKH